MEQKPCEMCMSAWNTEDLDSDHDLSFHTLYCKDGQYRMMLRAGARKPVTLLMEQWDEKKGWQTVGYYRPLYCPNCGRKLEKSAPKET